MLVSDIKSGFTFDSFCNFVVKAWRNWPTLLAKHCSSPNSNVR